MFQILSFHVMTIPRTIQLVTSQIADAIIEGAAEREAYEEEAYMEELAMAAKEEAAEEVEPKTKLRSRRKKKIPVNSRH